MRRTLIIAGIAITIIVVGIIAYFYFFTGSKNANIAPIGSTGLPVSGKVPTGTGGAGTQNVPTNTNTPTVISARLVKISDGPVVPGESVVNRKAVNASSSPETAINFIERESGNVFSYLMRAKTLTRTSNKTIPGIQSASWLPDGSTAFVRYLSDANFSTINTYALPANGVGGFFLPQNLSDIAVSSTSVLTLASGINGSTASTERPDGTHTTTVFASPLSSLRISFAGKSQYLATTKPSATLSGYAFLVDATGHFSRVAGPLNGLVTLPSPSGKLVLVSYTIGTGMQMRLVNVTTGEALVLPIATIADKCVWATDDSAIYCGVPINPPTSFSFPDDWYQGAMQFADRIWKIQVSGRYAQILFDFSKETGDSLDTESIAIDPAGTTIVFVNKNNGSLWSYSL